MSRQEFRDLSTQVSGLRDRMQATIPEYQSQRGGLESFRTGSLQPFTKSIRDWRTQDRPDLNMISGEYRGMITDPSKRGMSAQELAGQFSKQADVAGGAKTSYENSVRKQLAASGLGSTGAGLRALSTYAPTHEANMRSAMKDINLENESMKRDEYFKALTGLADTQSYADQVQKLGFGMEGEALGMESTNMNDMLKSLMAEQNVYSNEAGTFGTQEQALEQANKPGYWGSLLKGLLTNAVGGVGSGFGSAAAKKLFP